MNWINRGLDPTVRQRLLPLAALVAVALGGLLHLLDRRAAGDGVWAGSIALMLVPLSWSVARRVAHRDVGVDAIALVAMAGALVLGEYLAGAVVALMLAGGNALEASASRRARRELRTLLERMPRTARRRRGTVVEEVPVDVLVSGDTVVVRAGEVIAVDGVVESEGAVLDESALTGEPLPVSCERGHAVRSGSANAGDAFDLLASRSASESTYAGIVRLVRETEHRRAPFVRLADRYAAFFLPVTLVSAGAAWVLSGDPVRGLAVMVVATPCPLILAAPIAIISGVSRAARRGVIVKGGSAIEKLGEARTVLLDKTGTLTIGLPEVERVVVFDGYRSEEVLRLAASLDQLSAHVLAEALVHAAEQRGLELTLPTGVEEGRGQGIAGHVDGRRVAVGSAAWLHGRGYPDPERAIAAVSGDAADGRARILVGVDGAVAGAIVMGDHLRPDAAELVGDLRRAGVRHIALVTGDRRDVAEAVGRRVGVDRVYAEQTPEGKLDVVRRLRAQRESGPVVMVGDGVNDAPALALADVGIAMGFAGATVSSETADVVIVVDRIDRVADAVRIGRRSLLIARQSVLAGMAISLVAMGFAAFGLISPVAGALLQEGIDVAVIVNALRALRD